MTLTIDFLDNERVVHGNGIKVKFDGYGQGENGDRIEAYDLGVQTIYHLKVMSARKDYLCNATVYNRGQLGNHAILHVYEIAEDGTVKQVEYPAVMVCEFDFNGEGL